MYSSGPSTSSYSADPYSSAQANQQAAQYNQQAAQFPQQQQFNHTGFPPGVPPNQAGYQAPLSGAYPQQNMAGVGGYPNNAGVYPPQHMAGPTTAGAYPPSTMGAMGAPLPGQSAVHTDNYSSHTTDHPQKESMGEKIGEKLHHLGKKVEQKLHKNDAPAHSSTTSYTETVYRPEAGHPSTTQHIHPAGEACAGETCQYYTHEKFDQHGNKIYKKEKKEKYDEHGNKIVKKDKFDEHGNKIHKKDKVKHEGGHTIVEKDLRTERGLTPVPGHDSTSMQSKQQYEAAKDAAVVDGHHKHDKFDEHGNKKHKKDKYDEHGNKIKKEKFDEHGNKIHKKEKFDEHGNKIHKKEKFDEHGNKIHKKDKAHKKDKYDEHGNKIHKQHMAHEEHKYPHVADTKNLADEGGHFRQPQQLPFVEKDLRTERGLTPLPGDTGMQSKAQYLSAQECANAGVPSPSFASGYQQPQL